MSSLSNIYTQQKSLNGVNYIDADEITTDIFNVNTMSTTNLTVSGNSTFSLPPTMSGANISNSSIPIQSINGYSNICLLNSNNVFSTTTGDIIRTQGTNYFWINSNGSIGSINNGGFGLTNFWTISNTGVAQFTSDVNRFKYWEINGAYIRHYNLGGTYTIVLDGNSGNISLPNTLTSGNITSTNTTSTNITSTNITSTNITINTGGSLTLPNNSISDSSLSSNVPFKNITNTFSESNNFTGIINSDRPFRPIWTASNYTGSYRIGNNIGNYLNTLSTNNLCYGDNCLYGAYNSNPSLSRASENICIGHYTGYKFADVAGDNSSSCNRNVILGNNASKNGFVNCNDNVIIGYNCMASAPAYDKNVLIGSGVMANNGGGQTSSVIIGYNNLANSGANSGQNTILGYNNLLTFNGNGGVCIGANNGQNATDNNRGMWIGSHSGISHTTGTSCFYIGSENGNQNTTGYNNILIGNYITLSAGNYYNSTYIGHHDTNIGQDGIQASNEFVIGGCISGTGFCKLTLPNKNYINCCQYVSATNFYLNYRSEDTVILSSTTTNIYLPASTVYYNYNCGAKFTFIKNYSTATNITVNGSSGQAILNINGTSSTSINIPPSIYYFTVYTINAGTNATTWALDYHNVNASTITSGTISDSLLSSNVPLENTPNTFTQLNTFTNGILISGGSLTGNFNFNGSTFTSETIAGSNINAGNGTEILIYTIVLPIAGSYSVNLNTPISLYHSGTTIAPPSSTAYSFTLSSVNFYVYKNGVLYATPTVSTNNTLPATKNHNGSGTFWINQYFTNASMTQSISSDADNTTFTFKIKLNMSGSFDYGIVNTTQSSQANVQCAPSTASGVGYTAYARVSTNTSSLTINSSVLNINSPTLNITYPILYNSVYYIYSMYPNILSSNTTLSTPIYSSYCLLTPTTTAWTLTLPTPSANLLGYEILFKRITGGASGAVNVSPSIYAGSNLTGTTILTTTQVCTKIICLYLSATNNYAWYLSQASY